MTQGGTLTHGGDSSDHILDIDDLKQNNKQLNRDIYSNEAASSGPVEDEGVSQSLPLTHRRSVLTNDVRTQALIYLAEV